MCRPFVTQAERPTLVAGQLRLLLLLLLPLVEDFSVIRIVLYEDEEGSEGEGETACPKGTRAKKVAGNVGGGKGSTWSSWVRVRVGRLASR